MYLSKDKNESGPKDASDLGINNFIIGVVEYIGGFIECQEKIKCAESNGHNNKNK